MINIAFVLCDQMLSTSINWPIDILTACNQAALAEKYEKPPFQWTTTAVSAEPIKSSSTFLLQAETTLDEVSQVDIIYLPSLWRNPSRVISKNQAIIPWLQRHYENGAIITGVGTGCCFMAEAGLLDNKPATTHWYYFDQFQKNYPSIKLKRQHFITQAGNLYCAASINSLADLTIHFIQRFLNRTIAQHIERHFSHEVRQAYDRVSYLEDGNINHSDEDILQSQLWMKSNLEKNIKIKQIAQQFGISTRNFNRRFKEATNKTPLKYLQDLRITTAKDLLQSSNLTIGDIADKVGYNDLSHFTLVFRKSLSVTPSEYRTMVRAKLFREG